MSTALATMEGVYLRRGQLREFLHALGWYLKCGCVVSTPALFMMIRPVRHTMSEAEMRALVIEPWTECPEADAWFVAAGSGSPAEMLRAAPYDLPYICFQRLGRGGKIHTYETRRLAQRLGLGRNQQSNTIYGL